MIKPSYLLSLIVSLTFSGWIIEIPFLAPIWAPLSGFFAGNSLTLLASHLFFFTLIILVFLRLVAAVLLSVQGF